MDEVIAQLLVTEGFSTVEEVAFVPLEELSTIEGFDEEVAGELRDRARKYLEVREAELTERRKAAGVTDELAGLEGLTAEMLVTLGEAGVKTLDDLGDLASDELREVIGESVMTETFAGEIIMSARAHWFDDEPEEEGTEVAGGDEDDAGPTEKATETAP